MLVITLMVIKILKYRKFILYLIYLNWNMKKTASNFAF